MFLYLPWLGEWRELSSTALHGPLLLIHHNGMSHIQEMLFCFFPVGSLLSGGIVSINKTDMCCSLQNSPFICYFPALWCEMLKCSLLYLMVFKIHEMFHMSMHLRERFYNITQVSIQIVTLEFSITVTFFLSY